MTPSAQVPLTDPSSTVVAFFAAMEDGAVRQALQLTDPRIVWRNTSLPTVRGRLVGRILHGMDREWLGFRADFHHVAANSNVVLTERTDYLRFGPLEIDFWVCGTFALGPDGRIVLWHDYFSWSHVVGGTFRGLWRMARGSRPRPVSR